MPIVAWNYGGCILAWPLIEALGDLKLVDGFNPLVQLYPTSWSHNDCSRLVTTGSSLVTYWRSNLSLPNPACSPTLPEWIPLISLEYSTRVGMVVHLNFCKIVCAVCWHDCNYPTMPPEFSKHRLKSFAPCHLPGLHHTALRRVTA